MNETRRSTFAPRAGTWIAIWCGFVSGCGSGAQSVAAQPAAGTPVEAATVVTDTAIAAGQKLEIVARGGQCVVRATPSSAAQAQEFRLAPKAPCHFLRLSGSTSPRSLRYADVSTEAVLVVSGTPVSEASRAMWKLEPGLVCGEESQGVLVRKGKVLVTRAVRKGGITCRDKGVDEKEYWAFAHDER